MLLLVCWHKILKLSNEKVQHLVGGCKVNLARNHSMHKMNFFFLGFKVCNKVAISNTAPGNLQTNIYSWTCTVGAYFLQSMSTWWASGTNENLFLATGSWDDLSLFLLLNRSPLQPVPYPKINSLLLSRHDFPKLGLNSHWYNNNLEQSVKQKSAVFSPTFHCLLLHNGNMPRCTDINQ